MPRQCIQIQIDGEDPIRVITSPHKEQAGLFNVLVPRKGTYTGDSFDWRTIEEHIDLTDEEVVSKFFVPALFDLPFYPYSERGERITLTTADVLAALKLKD